MSLHDLSSLIDRPLHLFPLCDTHGTSYHPHILSPCLPDYLTKGVLVWSPSGGDIRLDLIQNSILIKQKAILSTSTITRLSTKLICILVQTRSECQKIRSAYLQSISPKKPFQRIEICNIPRRTVVVKEIALLDIFDSYLCFWGDLLTHK